MAAGRFAPSFVYVSGSDPHNRKSDTGMALTLFEFKAVSAKEEPYKISDGYDHHRPIQTNGGNLRQLNIVRSAPNSRRPPAPFRLLQAAPRAKCHSTTHNLRDTFDLVSGETSLGFPRCEECGSLQPLGARRRQIPAEEANAEKRNQCHTARHMD